MFGPPISEDVAPTARTSETIVSLDATDVRFPTSRELDGSDAMNPLPDYSAAYVIVRTSTGDEGHSLVFTIGRGTEVQVAAVRSLESLVVGLDVEDVINDPGHFSRALAGDSPMRWLGPEKGVIHMALGAVVNAVWDLRAQRERKPLWKLLAEMTPAEIVSLVDFRYIDDALTPAEALALLESALPGRAERQRRLLQAGYPAYTSTPGWLGYEDDKLVRLSRGAVDEGFGLIKLKVGGDLEADIRRLRLTREAVGPGVRIAIDANQIWSVGEAIRWVNELRKFDPYWIEEPTSPDDILGHAAIRAAVRPIRVATGEHAHNRIMFKQLLQANAIDVAQIDACRVGGVSENIAILLLAAKFGVPVCPHAGGVGLCEMVQHFAMFDFVAVSGTWDDRVIEYVDHLHEHFVEPAVVSRGRYVAPTRPGAGGRMRPESIAGYAFPDGSEWLRESSPAALATGLRVNAIRESGNGDAAGSSGRPREESGR